MICHATEVYATEDFDIDMYAVNVHITLQDVDNALDRLLGNTVALAINKRRKYPADREFDAIELAYHAAVIATKKMDGFETVLCHHLSEEGNVVLPTSDGIPYLVRGQQKSIPVTSFLRCIRRARMHFIRIIHFGMKQPIEDFPYLDLHYNFPFFKSFFPFFLTLISSISPFFQDVAHLIMDIHVIYGTFH